MNRKFRLSPFQIIVLGFLGLILIGTCLLMLPCSDVDGVKTSFLTSLFTATSAACVTGLVVVDTATHWSLFGQMVILILIQIGGLGVVTISAMMLVIAGKKISLQQRRNLQEALTAPDLANTVSLLKFIIGASFLVELIGAVLLSIRFIPEFGTVEGIWMSIFHSISAFCNAGFDLMGTRAKFSSLTYYRNDPLINLTIISIVTFAGLGFLTWRDILKNTYHHRKYRLQSKIILTMAAFLLFVPAIVFFFTEFQDMPPAERILASLFQSMTCRTAGFNTVDFSAMSESGRMLMIILMLIGGAPGSTAGGMKTTTVFVLLAGVIASFRQQDSVAVFRRRIPVNVIGQASTIVVLYVMLTLSVTVIMARVEELPLLDCLFETASAIATVGVTMGITPALHTITRIALICLMFFGRVGGLTLIYATVKGLKNGGSRLPKEGVTVG